MAKLKTDDTQAGPALLFVCFANQCRSPLAEAVMRQVVASHADTQLRPRIESAGTCASDGIPPHRFSVAAGKQHGVVVSGVSRAIHHTDLFDFDQILVMDRRNLADVEGLARSFGGVSSQRATIELLGSYGDHPGQDIADPIGSPMPAYLECYAQIDAACRGLWQHLLKSGHLKR